LYRYGPALLPPTIAREIFERVNSTRSEMEKLLMRTYYHLDTNAIPAVYSLKRDASFNYYAEEVTTLMNILDSVLFEEDLSDDLLVGRSISEWELKSMFNMEHNKSKLYWFHRAIEPSINVLPEEQQYFDARGDERKNDRLAALISYLTRRFEATTVSHFKAVKIESVLTDEGAYQAYLNDVRHDVNEILHKILSQVITGRSNWSVTGHGLGLPGDEVAEILVHSSFAFDCCQSFIGREELIRDIVEKIITAPGEHIGTFSTRT
jgi:hypothetical protein